MGKMTRRLLAVLVVALLGCKGEVRGTGGGREEIKPDAVGARGAQFAGPANRLAQVQELSASDNALSDFEARFSWNEVFECTGKGIHLSVGLGLPFTSDAQFNGLPQSVKASVLQLDITKSALGRSERMVSDWGMLAIDSADKRTAQLTLRDGRVIVFHRYGEIPNADAAEGDFDSRPFFTMTLLGERFQCGMAFNPK